MARTTAPPCGPGTCPGWAGTGRRRDRADLAAIVLELLAPLTARHLVLGAMHHRGAVAHWQGVCHRVLGDLHAAEGRLRQALAEHEDLDCPHWIALSADTLGMTTLTNRYTRNGLLTE